MEIATIHPRSWCKKNQHWNVACQSSERLPVCLRNQNCEFNDICRLGVRKNNLSVRKEDFGWNFASISEIRIVYSLRMFAVCAECNGECHRPFKRGLRRKSRRTWKRGSVMLHVLSVTMPLVSNRAIVTRYTNRFLKKIINPDKVWCADRSGNSCASRGDGMDSALSWLARCCSCGGLFFNKFDNSSTAIYY